MPNDIFEAEHESDLYQITIYLPEEDDDDDIGITELVGGPMAMAIESDVSFAVIHGKDDQGIGMLKMVSDDVTFMGYLMTLLHTNAEVVDISSTIGDA